MKESKRLWEDRRDGEAWVASWRAEPGEREIPKYALEGDVMEQKGPMEDRC
jgi:hypothetical protein